MTYIIIFLIISVILNVFFAFYLRWLLKNFTFLSDNIYNLLETIQTFSDHLGAVYELETFYGDETLWWFIAKANNMKFNNIPAGTKIRIPASPSGAYAVKSKDSSYLREQDGTS